MRQIHCNATGLTVGTELVGEYFCRYRMKDQGAYSGLEARRLKADVGVENGQVHRSKKERNPVCVETNEQRKRIEWRLWRLEDIPPRFPKKKTERDRHNQRKCRHQ